MQASLVIIHKQRFADVLQKKCWKNFLKFSGKHLCRSFLFNKAYRLKVCNFIKRRLQQRSFPVNFAKSFRTRFSRSTYRWLRLQCLIMTFYEPLYAFISLNDRKATSTLTSTLFVVSVCNIAAEFFNGSRCLRFIGFSMRQYCSYMLQLYCFSQVFNIQSPWHLFDVIATARTDYMKWW